MKSLNVIVGMLCVSVLIAGCASGVTRDSSDSAKRTQLSKDNQVAEISVSLTEEAKNKVADNLKFDPAELKNHVQRAMDAKSLLKPESKGTLPVLAIEVKDIRVRSNFSAVMFGFMAGADSITGDIVVKDVGGREIDRFEVSASYALGGLAGGQDSARMGWLYEKFAEETVKELTKQ
ncbi:MAG: DUF4410 domain-containing protein [Gammaproteobacteria bacterium]|nr:DUF4410 domain-containing protein [Gammaproteobacteria bacterium]